MIICHYTVVLSRMTGVFQTELSDWLIRGVVNDVSLLRVDDVEFGLERDCESHRSAEEQVVRLELWQVQIKCFIAKRVISIFVNFEIFAIEAAKL